MEQARFSVKHSDDVDVGVLLADGWYVVWHDPPAWVSPDGEFDDLYEGPYRTESKAAFTAAFAWSADHECDTDYVLTTPSILDHAATCPNATQTDGTPGIVIADGG